LSGEVYGKKTSGCASVTPEEGENTIDELSWPVAALQVSEVQLPAVTGVTPGELKHLQEVQEGLEIAAEEQQHPPRQRFVPQSKLEAQGSPGELSTQEPVGVQAEQLRKAEELEQQKPPRQAPEAQQEEEKQEAPGYGGPQAVPVAELVGETVGVADDDIVCELDGVGHGPHVTG
jgi:hypothetical protein